MSRFEQEGVDRQYEARTIQAAIRAFNYSCDRCCYTGRHISCNSCAIANAHHEALDSFEKRRSTDYAFAL